MFGNTRRFSVLLCVIALSVMVFAGCGDDDDPAGAGSAPVGTEAPTHVGDSQAEASGETDPSASMPGTEAPGTEAPGTEAPGTGAGACTVDETLCVTLNIPSDFDGTPDRLFVAGYSSLPPMGPPDAFLPTIDNPEIVAGEPYAVRLEEVVDRGDYFLYVVIYDEEGGQFTPEAGVDYVGFSDAPQSFDGGPVNFTAIDMVVAAPMGGQ